VYNYTDWFRSAAWPDDDYVPLECCVTNVTNCNIQHQPILWHKKVSCVLSLACWCGVLMQSLSFVIKCTQSFFIAYGSVIIFIYNGSNNNKKQYDCKMLMIS